MNSVSHLLFIVGILAWQPVWPDEVEQGRLLYEIYCTQCHGKNGTGEGINVRDMSVQPRNHTDSDEMITRTDEDLEKVIKQGGKSVDKSVLMPAWGDNLSDEQVEALVKYLRELCCRK